MNLIERVKAIILTPKTEWPVIEQESGEAAYLFTQYVAILALIPAVAGFIGSSLIGVSVPPVGTVRMPIFAGLFNALLGYVLSFVVVYVVALIINALAPTFGGVRHFPNALKLAVYSSTASWLAGIFLILPGLTFLTLLGLYGFYLLWLGLPVLMKASGEKATLYTVAVAVCTVLVAVVFGLLQTALATFPG
jgi:hypothetical protein